MPYSLTAAVQSLSPPFCNNSLSLSVCSAYVSPVLIPHKKCMMFPYDYQCLIDNKHLRTHELFHLYLRYNIRFFAQTSNLALDVQQTHLSHWGRFVDLRNFFFISMISGSRQSGTSRSGHNIIKLLLDNNINQLLMYTSINHKKVLALPSTLIKTTCSFHPTH